MAGEIKEEIQGTVESVIYRNEANGYTILEVFAEQKKRIGNGCWFFPFRSGGRIGDRAGRMGAPQRIRQTVPR